LDLGEKDLAKLFMPEDVSQLRVMFDSIDRYAMLARP
jgi:hypothetical protein